jgi:hypothetical protein
MPTQLPRPPLHAPLSRNLARLRAGVLTAAICAAAALVPVVQALVPPSTGRFNAQVAPASGAAVWDATRPAGEDRDAHPTDHAALARRTTATSRDRGGKRRTLLRARGMRGTVAFVQTTATLAPRPVALVHGTGSPAPPRRTRPRPSHPVHPAPTLAAPGTGTPQTATTFMSPARSSRGRESATTKSMSPDIPSSERERQESGTTAESADLADARESPDD